MHSKQVRRRRAVVAALVVVSLILLTAYFGGSSNNPLHTVQRGVVTVFSPIQKGASVALSPFRDIANFFSDTFKAKSQVAGLRTEVHALQAKLAQAEYAASLNSQLSKQVGLDSSDSIASYRPVTADVTFRDPSLWYATVNVDKGTADGIRMNDPVTGDGALVGQVTAVGSNFSIVTLITDHTMAEAAQVEDPGSDTGVLVPAVGNPNQLVLQDLPRNASVQTGQIVNTVGFKAGQLQDLYPPGIPIGQVSYVGNDLANNGQVQVTPVADLRHFDVVQILTAPHAGTARAQLPTG
ncbi:MAG TPA: rod shape-determining protein MreC [Solirubrobacteraceae bacterium]|nr:rod shape-determining protein MreC [Solirubrobacteraceae bacterium]